MSSDSPSTSRSMSVEEVRELVDDLDDDPSEEELDELADNLTLGDMTILTTFVVLRVLDR